MSEPTRESLEQGRCVPCEGGVPKLTPSQVESRLAQVEGWRLDGERIGKRFEFGGFVELMAFTNRMADLAEAEGHHPDFSVHYNKLDVQIWTHAIGGLSDNDFILAAKIDRLAL